jgi:hypothetical protein
MMITYFFRHRIQSTKAQESGGQISPDSFAAHAQSAADKKEAAAKY